MAFFNSPSHELSSLSSLVTVQSVEARNEYSGYDSASFPAVNLSFSAMSAMTNQFYSNAHRRRNMGGGGGGGGGGRGWALGPPYWLAPPPPPIF